MDQQDILNVPTDVIRKMQPEHSRDCKSKTVIEIRWKIVQFLHSQLWRQSFFR